MSDGCYFHGGYDHDEHPATFDIAAEVAKATGKWLADNAIPLTTAEIPKSLLRRNQDDYDANEPGKE